MTWIAKSVVDPARTPNIAEISATNMERVELDQHVEADEAEDVEDVLDPVQDLDPRAELHAVGRDREVDLGASRSGCRARSTRPRRLSVADVHRRRRVGRMEAADASAGSSGRRPSRCAAPCRR